MKHDRSDFDHLLAEDCAEHRMSAVWLLALLVVIALPVLVVMLRF